MEGTADLVLVGADPEEQRLRRTKLILPNIRGQKYTFGPTYPAGEREGEEFVFIIRGQEEAHPGVIISVDDQGRFWIQNDTRTAERMTTRRSIFNTFVNGERVKGVVLRLLKSGDVISLGGGPTFSVEERVLKSGGSSTNNEEEAAVSPDPDSPLENTLILSKLMTYLPVVDLKSARLVCRKWRDEARKPLEKRGKVSFAFNGNPEKSTRVFRYLHEMGDLKIQNLRLHLNPNFPHQKSLDDLRKLLKSPHSFSTLALNADIHEESDLFLFSTVLQELGGKLVELELDGSLYFLPEVLPPFPMMTNLKKFTDLTLAFPEDDDEGEDGDASEWVSFLVPLFSGNLEALTCKHDLADLYFQSLQAMPNLRGIEYVEGEEQEPEPLSDSSLSHLLSLPNPLTSLKLVVWVESDEQARLLGGLLSKHSQTLQTLHLRIDNVADVRFPPFPVLEDLALTYYADVGRITWATPLDYKTHFPSLRKLTVDPSWWWMEEEDPVFRAFFPDDDRDRIIVCETVKELSVRVHPEVEGGPVNQPKMDRITRMFPNAVKVTFLQPSTSLNSSSD